MLYILLHSLTPISLLLTFSIASLSSFSDQDARNVVLIYLRDISVIHEKEKKNVTREKYNFEVGRIVNSLLGHIVNSGFKTPGLKFSNNVVKKGLGNNNLKRFVCLLSKYICKFIAKPIVT